MCELFGHLLVIQIDMKIGIYNSQTSQYINFITLLQAMGDKHLHLPHMNAPK